MITGWEGLVFALNPKSYSGFKDFFPFSCFITSMIMRAGLIDGCPPNW